MRACVRACVRVCVCVCVVFGESFDLIQIYKMILCNKVDREMTSFFIFYF